MTVVNQKPYDSEKLFRKSFKAFTDLVFIVDRDGTYLDFIEYKEFPFVPHEQLIGKKITDIMPRDTGRLQMNIVKETFETQQTQTLEFCLSIEGETYYYENRFVYISKETVAIFVRDISKSRLTEQKLNDTEAKFKMLFDGSNDALFLHDLDSNFIEVNQTACERLGYTRDELLQMTPMDIDTPLYASKVAKRIKKLKKTGSSFFETAHVSKDGKEIPIELSSKVIKYEGKDARTSPWAVFKDG